MAIGTITASWQQAAGIVFVIALTSIAGSLCINYQTADLYNWPFQLALKAIFVFAAILVPALQYGRRNTVASRGVFAVAAICALAVSVTPRTTGYEIQRVFDYGNVAAAGPIHLSFDDQPKAKVIGKAPPFMAPVIYIPLKVVVYPGRIIAINQVDASFASDDGKPLYRGAISVLTPTHSFAMQMLQCILPEKMVEMHTSIIVPKFIVRRPTSRRLQQSYGKP